MIYNNYIMLGNKVLEFQLSKWDAGYLFDIEFWGRDKGTHDHHGWDVFITLFGYEFNVSFYDVHHKDEL